MNYSDIKELKAICSGMFIDDWRSVVSYMADDADDFEVEDYRFINRNAIDDIQQDELASDEYVLGCFAPWLLADVLDLGMEAIEDLQNKEAHEALGKMVIARGVLDHLQEEYVRHDGYGHHFAHYDGQEHDVGTNYLAFKVN